jgi:hypothetical protein
MQVQLESQSVVGPNLLTRKISRMPTLSFPWIMKAWISSDFIELGGIYIHLLFSDQQVLMDLFRIHMSAVMIWILITEKLFPLYNWGADE